MKEIITTLLVLITLSLSAQSDTLAYEGVYTKQHFNKLYPNEKSLVRLWCKQKDIKYPIWKDTTLVQENKFEVHNWAKRKRYKLIKEREQRNAWMFESDSQYGYRYYYYTPNYNYYYMRPYINSIR